MKPLLAFIVLMTLAGCVTPVPRFDEKAARARLTAESAVIEAKEAPLRAKQAKAKAEYDQWLADQHGARFLELHPEIADPTKRAILAGELIVGMTKPEAWAAVGPMLPRTESDGAGGKWSMWESVEGADRYYLFFENDRLVRWNKKH